MFDAFMSYSHAADGKLAPAIQRALHRFAKPLWRNRAMRVFRDKSTLALTPKLWPDICEAMSASTWFILLASPDAAASQWVNDEVRYWLDHHGGPTNLLIVLTAGQIAWAGTDFDWSVTTALPAALKGAFATEPLYVDLRDKREEALSLRHPQFIEDVATIAAAVRGVPRDTLIGDDIRAHRLLRLMTVTAVTVISALFVLAAAAAWIAQNERQTSDARRQLTEASLLGGEAARMPTDWARLTKEALAEAVTGATHLGDRGDPFPLERNERLREVVRRLPSSVHEIEMPGEIHGLFYSRDGAALLIGGQGILRGGRLGPKLPETESYEWYESVMAADLSVAGGITALDRVLYLWSTVTGRELPCTWDGKVTHAALSPSGRLLATMDAGHVATIRDVVTGKAILRHQFNPYQDDLTVAFSDDEKRALLAADTAALMVDLKTGRERPVLDAPGRIEGADFSDDGSAVAFITSCRVFVFDATTLAQRMMTATEDCEDVDWRNMLVRLSSDAGRVTVVRDHLSPSTYQVPSGEIVWPRNVTGIWTIDTTYHGVTADGSVVVRYEGDAITMFSTENGEVLARIMAPREPTGLAIDPVHRRIALAYGRRLLLFEAVGGDQQSEEADFAAVRRVARSYDGRRVLVATDREVTVWSSEQGCLYRVATPTPQSVWMSADGHVAAWTEGAQVVFVRIGDRGEVTILPRFEPSRPLHAVGLTDDGRHAVLSGPGYAVVRELGTGRTVFEDAAADVSVAVDPSSRVIATASARDRGTIRLIPFGGNGAGESVSLPAQWRSVTPSLAFTTAGRYLLVAVSKKQCLLYDPVRHAFASLPPAVASGDYYTQYFADDRYVLVARPDNGSGSNKSTPALVWDLRTMLPVMSVVIDDAPSAVAIDSGGTLVAIAGVRHHDNVITLFDVERRREVMRIASAEKISSLLFSNDRSCLVSGGDGGLLRVWKIDRERATAVEQARLQHQRSVVYAAFSGDGQILMSIESDRADGYRAHLWRWSSEALLAHAKLCLRLFEARAPNHRIDSNH